MSAATEPDVTTLHLLGPVRLQRNGKAVPVRSALVRTLLAVLALAPGAPRDPWVLIEELWGEGLPSDPKGSLHVQVTKLRRWLESAGLAPGCLTFDPAGYVLDVPRRVVDLHTFNDLAQRVGSLGSPVDVVAACDAALALWDGPVFGGCVPGLELESESLRLDEMRLEVQERRCEALLAAGSHDLAAAELVALAARHPARERLARTAAVALYRQGRQTDALRIIRDTRSHLLEEYGLDAGPDLVRLEGQILAQDADLGGGARDDAAKAAPDQPAPSESSGFVGRGAVLERLLDVQARGGLSLLTGPAGIGKSALVRAAAEEARFRGWRAVVVTWGPDPSPLAGWAQVLSGLDADPDSLRPEVSGSPAARLRVVLAAQTRHAPVLVAFDDVHLADSASLHVLRDVVSGGVPAGVAIIVSARPPESEASAEWAGAAAELLLREQVSAVELGPLDRDDVHDLVGHRLTPLRLDDSDRAELTELLWSRTAGHPFHLCTVLDVLATQPDMEECRRAVMSVPDRLRPLVEHQLATLPAAARDAIDAIASLGPLPPDDLARYGATTPLEVNRSLRAARALGLVVDVGGRWDISHAIIRDVVSAGLPDDVSQFLHMARYAELAGRPGDPFRALRHAVGAGPLMSPADEVGIRMSAARLAYQRGAFRETLDILRPVRAETPGAARLELLLQLGLAHTALGQQEEADALLGQVVDDAAASVELVVAAAVGDEPLGIRVGGDAGRRRRLQAAEVRTRGRADSLRLAVVCGLLIEDIAGPEGAGAEIWAEFDRLRTGALAPADRVMVAATLGPRLIELGDVRTLLATAEDGYRAAAAASDVALTLTATRQLMRAVLAVGDVERAEELRWALDRSSQRAGRPVFRWAARITEAALLLAAGDENSSTEAEQALDLGLSLGIPDAFGAYGVFLLTRAWMTGQVDTLLGPIEEAIETYPDAPAWRAAAAVVRASAGDLDLAARHLSEFMRRRNQERPQTFDRAGLCLAVTAAARLEARDAAAEIRRALAPEPETVVVVGGVAAVFGPLDLYVGLAEAVLGHREEASVHLASATATSRRAGWRPWAAAAAHVSRRYLGDAADEVPSEHLEVTLGL